MKSISKIVSIIFHPVVVSLIGVYIIVFSATGSVNQGLYWTTSSAVFSMLLGFFVLFGVKRGFFNNFDVSNRKQRVVLYPFTIFVVLLFSSYVYFADGPKILIISGILFIVSLTLLDVVNSRIKASIHVASMAAFSTGVVYLYGAYFLPIYLLVMISGYARIVIKRHTLKEVVIGALSGSLLTLSGIYVVKFILNI